MQLTSYKGSGPYPSSPHASPTQALLVPPSMLHLKGWKIAKTLQKKVLEGDFRSQWPRQCVQWVEGIILHLWQFSWLDLTMF